MPSSSNAASALGCCNCWVSEATAAAICDAESESDDDDDDDESVLVEGVGGEEVGVIVGEDGVIVLVVDASFVKLDKAEVEEGVSDVGGEKGGDGIEDAAEEEEKSDDIEIK